MKEKLKFITDILGATDIEIAKRAGLPKETMSRLRAGTRVLKRNSKQLSKLAKGIYEFAQEHFLIRKLQIGIQCISEDETEIRERLLDWFVDGEMPEEKGLEKLPKHRATRRRYGIDMNLSSFGNRLKALMGVTDMTNARLAEETELGVNYISRLRGSEEVSKTDSGSVEMISRCIAREVEEKEKYGRLAELTGIPEAMLRTERCQTYVQDFLLWTGDFSAREAIGEFLKQVRAQKGEVGNQLPDPEEIIKKAMAGEPKSHYIGVEGLREAVLRFLANALRRGDEEILLYSDQGMEWMEGEYMAKCSSLMQECLKRGARIRIVHNIDRKIPEMLSAIRFWMPFYLMGRVESHYSTRSLGKRFSNTFFISKGAAVMGTCCKGGEEKCLYQYQTDDEAMQFAQDTFERLLAESEALFSFQTRPAHLSGKYHIYGMDDMEICIGNQNVIVNKLAEPYLSFEFRHVLMVRAFREFVGEKER